MTDGRTLDWTFEVPAAGDGASGLEDYVVEDARGGHAGKVATLLRHEERVFVAVELGTPPLQNEVAVVPWDAVRNVDHGTLTVRLGLEPDDLERVPRLDQSRKVESGEAEATRVTEVPGGTVPAASPAAPGPIDRESYALALWTGALGLFAMLVLAIMAAGVDFTWHYVLFLIPAALLAFAGIQAYRVFRNPYDRRRAA